MIRERNPTTDSVTAVEIVTPDDWHLHLRDGAPMESVIIHSGWARRAIIMPNLKPPVRTVANAMVYRERILAGAWGCGINFEPLMTLYLTDKTTVEDVNDAACCEYVVAFKMYPAGATTNSSDGVTNLRNHRHVLARMEALDVPLLMHGEVTASDVDIFDRELCFIDTVLSWVLKDFPRLRIVFEHITTKDAVQFVTEGPETLAATVTPQHMCLNRNHMLVGGIHPHNYCLPVPKREEHRVAVAEAATSGNPKFFLGTDSAPHAKGAKESACGCAGAFNASVALPMYVGEFERQDKLENFERFASLNGPAFYHLPPNKGTIRIIRRPWSVPEWYPFGDTVVVPLLAGRELEWQLETA